MPKELLAENTRLEAEKLAAEKEKRAAENQRLDTDALELESCRTGGDCCSGLICGADVCLLQ